MQCFLVSIFQEISPESFEYLLVGPLRFELRTSAMSRRRHNRLDHEPYKMLVVFTPYGKMCLK